MSKISFELYEQDVEVLNVMQDSESELCLQFSSTDSGFVRLGERAERLSDGACIFDLRLLDNGEYTPELFLEDKRIALPTLKKTGCLIEIDDCTADYIRKASQRERALRALVKTLEEKIGLLEDRVYGTTIL